MHLSLLYHRLPQEAESTSASDPDAVVHILSHAVRVCVRESLRAVYADYCSLQFNVRRGLFTYSVHKRGGDSGAFLNNMDVNLSSFLRSNLIVRYFFKSYILGFTFEKYAQVLEVYSFEYIYISLFLF